MHTISHNRITCILPLRMLAPEPTLEPAAADLCTTSKETAHPY